MNTCLLIPILTGLLSALLGYLLGRMTAGGNTSVDLNLQRDLDACKANTLKLNNQIASLEADLKVAKASAATNVQSFAASVATVSAGVAAMSYDADKSFAVLGKKWKQDDLKIVEGIGPKIEELYHAAGIKTWKELSETSAEKSQSILDAAGERYSIHNPGTWAKQALLAYEGKWQELKDWQDSLDGGKE
jgi:predicted flap endonuclease-1-like 5' DNA nuclease